MAEQKRKADKDALKLAKEAAEKENAALFKGMDITSNKLKSHNQFNTAGQDPKSILCPDFKLGNCNKGRNCKYSHDINIERKTAKIDLYTDPRTIDKDGNTITYDTTTKSNETHLKGMYTVILYCIILLTIYICIFMIIYLPILICIYIHNTIYYTRSNIRCNL